MSKLYTPRLLALSAQLAEFPLSRAYDLRSETRSRTCGSTLELGVDADENGAVQRLGLRVSACAIGQSSAAVMATEAKGRTASDFDRILESIQAWLAGKAPAPEWPGFDALEPALPHPARHGALLLPWKAMSEALSSRDPNS